MLEYQLKSFNMSIYENCVVDLDVLHLIGNKILNNKVSIVDIIKEAHEKPPISDFSDDSSLIEALGTKVKIFSGSTSNIKITFPNDLKVASYILDSINDSNTIRSSIGLAANVFTPIGPLSWTFSQSLSKASTDVTETFNFNIGTSF